MPKSINKQVQEYQESQKGWRFHAQAVNANRVFATINESLFDGKLPEPVIGFNVSGRLKKDGSYHWEGDGISLSHHIDLRQDLTDLELVIGLIHNAVHLSQEIYGAKTTWYHSASFRKALKDFGIKVAANGDTIGLLPAFTATLETLGRPDLSVEPLEVNNESGLVGDLENVGNDGGMVETLVIPEKVPSPLPPKLNLSPKATVGSPMKKWVCQCPKGKNILRTTIVNFNSTCNNCETQWVYADTMIDAAVAVSI